MQPDLLDILNFSTLALLEQYNQKSDTQKKIILAAMEAFSDKGFAGTTTASLAKLANVTEKTMFKHFRSKDHLYYEVTIYAILNLINPDSLKRLTSLPATGIEDSADSLKRFFRFIVKEGNQKKAIFKFVCQELLLNETFRTILYNQLYATMVQPAFEQFITRAQAHEQISRQSPDKITRHILMTLIGFLMTRNILIKDHDFDDEDEIEYLTDVLFYGFGNV